MVTGETQISGNPSAGIFVDGLAGLYATGSTVITNNGALGNSDSGGIVATNNAGAEIDSITISNNPGWGLTGSLGATYRLSSNNFGGNGLGIIGCDNSSWMIADFPGNTQRSHCNSPVLPVAGSPIKPLHLLGNEPSRDPVAMAETVRKARASFWAAMRGERPM